MKSLAMYMYWVGMGGGFPMVLLSDCEVLPIDRLNIV